MRPMRRRHGRHSPIARGPCDFARRRLKHSGTRRDQPIPQEAVRLLRAIQSPDARSPGAAFLSEELRDANAAHKVWKRACLAAGAVKAVTGGFHGTRQTLAHRIYDLRHTFGHRLGADPTIAPHTIRGVMGHPNLETTERYLGRAEEARRRSAVNRAATAAAQSAPNRSARRRRPSKRGVTK
jgi:integrase